MKYEAYGRDFGLGFSDGNGSDDGQVAIRGRRGIVDILILPRPLTRLVLILVGVGLGGFCACWFDPMLNARIAAAAGGFCMLCAAVMWRIPESSGENALGGTAASSGSLSAEIFRAAREKARTLRRRALLWSGWVVACAAAASLPALIASAVCAWMLLLAGGAVGEAVYLFFAVHALKEELHAFRDRHAESVAAPATALAPALVAATAAAAASAPARAVAMARATAKDKGERL